MAKNSKNYSENWRSRAMTFLLGNRNNSFSFRMAAGLCAFFSIVVYLNSQEHFWYDASGYWDTGKQMFSGGVFSFLKFDFPLRGYLFPFLLGSISRIAEIIHVNDMLLFKFISAFLVTCCVYIIVPFLLKHIFSFEMKNYSIVLLSLALAYFWRGLFDCPLADFPSFLALGFAFSCLLRKSSAAWFFAGLALSFALITRTVYFASIPFLLIFMYFQCKNEKIISAYILQILFFAAGIVIAYAPQVYINKKLYNTYSPMTQTSVYYKENSSLFWKNVDFGIKVQKYETLISKEYPEPGVMSLSRMGKKIELGRNGVPINSLHDWLSIMKHYPLEYSVLLGAHLVNAIDLMYPTVYIETLRRSLVFSLANFTLWFLFFAVLIQMIRQRPSLNTFKVVFILGFMAPVLGTIASHVESRFYFIWFFAMYLILATHLEIIKSMLRVKYFPFYILFVFVCGYFSIQTTLAIPNLEFKWSIF